MWRSPKRKNKFRFAGKDTVRGKCADNPVHHPRVLTITRTARRRHAGIPVPHCEMMHHGQHRLTSRIRPRKYVLAWHPFSSRASAARTNHS